MISRLVILNDVSVARGGATGLALASIRALRARNIPVTLIVGDNGENPELKELGVEVVTIGQALLLDAAASDAFFRGLYNRRTFAVVEDWIAQNDNRRTIYHVHTWSKILSPSLFRALRPVAQRLVLSAHDFFLVCPNGGYVHYDTGNVCQLRPMSSACVLSDCDRRSYAQKLWRVARHAIKSIFFDLGRTPSLVLAIHDGMREGLERGGVPGRAIRILRNPVCSFTTHRVTAERNQEIFFIGRLHAEKGPDLAAKAASLAGVKLRMIGDGPMRESLKRNHPEVALEGQRSHEDIGGLIASARAIVVPSRYPEPFGLVVGEALWSGLPVMISDTALMAGEIVARGAGLACDVRNDEAFAEGLRQIFASDAETHRMSKNAFSATRDLCNTPVGWSEALISIYENIVAATT